jgi:phosphohistidine phosphatase
LKDALRTYEGLSARVLEQPDEETVHAFRVASRRLQVALDVARRVLPSHDAANARRRLKMRFEATGSLRDAQIWRLLTGTWSGRFPEAAALLDGHLAALEERQRERALRVLRKKPMGPIVDEVGEVITAARRDRDDSGLERVVERRLDRAFQRLERARRAVDPARAETLHAFRLELKGARYAVELAAPFHAERAPFALEAFRLHQTSIGDWHDLDLLVHAFELFCLEAPALVGPCAGLFEAARGRLAEARQALIERLPVAADLDPRPARERVAKPWTLVLLRHALAVDRDEWRDRPDAERPLTPRGEKQARRVGKVLAGWGLKLDRVLASPALRAWRTAEIVAHVVEAEERLERFDALAADADPREVVEVLAASPRPRGALVLVGHEPGLGQLASMLVSGRRSVPIEIPKAGLVAITLDEIAWRSCGRLVRLAPPDEEVKRT